MPSIDYTYEMMKQIAPAIGVDAINQVLPALVSKSMPTVQSLELAEEYGLKLFIRQKK